jgi:hypothetical protein
MLSLTRVGIAALNNYSIFFNAFIMKVIHNICILH